MTLPMFENKSQTTSNELPKATIERTAITANLFMVFLSRCLDSSLIDVVEAYMRRFRFGTDTKVRFISSGLQVLLQDGSPSVMLRDSKILWIGTKVIYGAFGRILGKMELANPQPSGRPGRVAVSASDGQVAREHSLILARTS
jgi:hypothetical protein